MLAGDGPLDIAETGEVMRPSRPYSLATGLTGQAIAAGRSPAAKDAKASQLTRATFLNTGPRDVALA